MGDDWDKTCRHIPSSAFIVGQHRTCDGQAQSLKLNSEGALTVVAPLTERSQAQANFGKEGIHTRIVERRLVLVESPAF